MVIEAIETDCYHKWVVEVRITGQVQVRQSWQGRKRAQGAEDEVVFFG